MCADAPGSVNWVEAFGASINDRSDDPDAPYDRMPEGMSYADLMGATRGYLDCSDAHYLSFVTPGREGTGDRSIGGHTTGARPFRLRGTASSYRR